MDISPLRTLKSSGSSSKLVLRKIRPNRGNRFSLGNKLPLASRASVMVRNLYIVNGLPSKPGRTCRKKMGLSSFAQTSSATKASRGESTTSPGRVSTRSSSLLPKPVYKCFNFSEKPLQCFLFGSCFEKIRQPWL